MTSSHSESIQALSGASDDTEAAGDAVDALLAVENLSPPTFDDIAAAAHRLEGFAVKTPLLTSPALDTATGGRVFIKPETLQRTGSFKFRGAFNRISQLSEEQRARGVVAYSSGNHAQGVAEAARVVGAPATIFIPEDAPRAKIVGTTSRGAKVIGYDRATESREQMAVDLARETGGTLTPPYDHPHIIAGQGTVGLEVLTELEARDVYPDVLMCPVGGGGLMAGVALAFEAGAPDTRLYAVEPQGFDDTGRSLVSGQRELVSASEPSICDALMAPTPGRLTFAINQPRLTGGLAVTDAETRDAMVFAFTQLKLALEPGGAAALAAALTGKIDLRDQTVVVICTGANVSPSMFADVLSASGA